MTALDRIRRREDRRQAMIEDGSYRITQMRCNDPERHGIHGSHPANVWPETSLHPSYISHLEALADSVPNLLRAVEAVEKVAADRERRGFHSVAQEIRAALAESLGD